MELGESLVAAYLRHVRGCGVILGNVYLSGVQGELDVVGLKEGAPQHAWFCEVTTHIRGMNNPTRRPAARRVKEKLARSRTFAAETFPNAEHHFEVWSPRVRPGILAELEGLDVELVVNAEYTRRIQELVDVARGNPSTTGEPAFRFLQILTHVQGELRL